MPSYLTARKILGRTGRQFRLFENLFGEQKRLQWTYGHSIDGPLAYRGRQCSGQTRPERQRYDHSHTFSNCLPLLIRRFHIRARGEKAWLSEPEVSSLAASLRRNVVRGWRTFSAPAVSSPIGRLWSEEAWLATSACG